MKIRTVSLPIRGACLDVDIHEPDFPVYKDAYIFFHGFSHSKKDGRAFGEWIARRGRYGVVPSMRQHGNSTGTYSPQEAAKDAIEIARWLKSEGMRHVVEGGYSLGAYIALMGLTYDDSRLIDGCFLLQIPNRPIDYQRRYSLARFISRWTVPILNALPESAVERFGVTRKGDEWRIKELRTTDLYALKRSIQENRSALEIASHVHGYPVHVVYSWADWHIMPSDSLNIFNALRASGNDVGRDQYFLLNPRNDYGTLWRVADSVVSRFEHVFYPGRGYPALAKTANAIRRVGVRAGKDALAYCKQVIRKAPKY